VRTVSFALSPPPLWRVCLRTPRPRAASRDISESMHSVPTERRRRGEPALM
jgi:hypothetical protein